MSKIVIIGAGAMGSAFALPCLDNNHDINIVGTHLENEFIDMAKETRLSDKYIIENYETNVCKNLFVPKILNVVSRYCFYQGFQEFLTQLFL